MFLFILSFLYHRHSREDGNLLYNMLFYNGFPPAWEWRRVITR